MINHYRTLLLNLPDKGDPNEYISPGFLPVALPPELQAFYNLLYPAGSSRFYTQFIEFYCESLLHASNQTDMLKSIDSRITYDLSDLSNYFAINQVTQPVNSAYNYPLLLSGSYSVSPKVNSYFEGFTISQVGESNNILIFSNVSKLYVNGSVTSTTGDTTVQIPLTFSNGMSNIFTIGATGISGRIGGDGSQFGSTGDKQWTFIGQAPISFDFITFYNTMNTSQSVVNNMLAYGPTSSNDVNLWNQHFNPVYKLVGLINSYVYKVNSVWQT
jgi:hypothetical protein